MIASYVSALVLEFPLRPGSHVMNVNVVLSGDSSFIPGEGVCCFGVVLLRLHCVHMISVVVAFLYHCIILKIESTFFFSLPLTKSHACLAHILEQASNKVHSQY